MANNMEVANEGKKQLRAKTESAENRQHFRMD